MKILYTNFHQGNGGGHDTYIFTLCAGLFRDHDITVAIPDSCTLTQKLMISLPTVKVINASFKIRLNQLRKVFKQASKLRQLIKAEKFDVIHVNGSGDNSMIILASLFLKNRPKIIYTKHNSLKIKWGAKIRSRYFTDALIAVSQHTKNMYGNSIAKKVPIKVIQNGIDIDFFKPFDADFAKKMRQKWNIPDNALVFGSVAGTAVYKGWHLLLEAIAALRHEITQPIRVVIAGTLPSQEIIDAYVKKYQLENEVIFTGLISDVREVIAVMDIGFVLSYEVETISFACREMMASAKPVLVSDYAGLAENITPNMDGWVVPCKDVQALKTCLGHILENLKQLDQMSVQARNKAVQQFSHDAFISDTLTLYENLARKL